MTREVVNLFPHEWFALDADRRRVMSGKFIVVVSPDFEALIFGPLNQFHYHADLLRKFCGDRQISSYWSDGRERLEIDDPDIQVRGGGYVVFELAKNRAIFSGQSKAYGPFKPEILNRLVKCDSFPANFTVLFE